MDDEPMWAADRVVAPTPGSAITILETVNEFAIKGNHLTLVKGNQFDGRIKTDPHKHIHEFLGICDMFKYRDTKNETVRLMMFPILVTGEARTWLDELNKGTIETWDELRTTFISRFFPPSLFDRLLGEIREFSQHENETLTNAWLRMKEMLMNCHGHNLTKGYIIKIFEDEDEESTPQPKSQTLKSVRETPMPKPYKPKIPYPQRLRKEKMEAQYEGMPNHGKFLKELVSNKHKLEQISSAFLSDESSAMIQNKIPPKPEDLRSFLIPCTLIKTFSYNALADLGASINLIPYSLYAKLSLETLKPTKMSVRLADRSFQYPIGIAENMLVEVGKFTFSVDFVILEMEEDNIVALILGRPFLHTADAVIRILKDDSDALLDEGSDILYSIEGTILEEKLFVEFDEFMAMTVEENSKSDSDKEEPTFEKITFDTDYIIKTSLKEPPLDLELKPLLEHLEYVFLEEPYLLPVIISSQISEQNKNKLVSILKRHKQAFSWKTTDIPGICPSFCKH
ncbi:reverse transcriptase domain-containing protein [Tanacetum coccineum]